MNFKDVPCRSSKHDSVHPSHFGPGSQWGKPYYNCGQEHAKLNATAPPERFPMDLSRSRSRQTLPNVWDKESTLRTFGDPPSSRSCTVSINKDGLCMDSHTHVTKIGSKHMCDPRPSQPLSFTRSLSVPGRHPYELRRTQFSDPTPWHFNAAFSTTNDEIGKFYSSPWMPKTELDKMTRAKYDWTTTKKALR
mmetsp:Transcript_21222/g.38740  ORF Transcript_21222/g.38740 Transcript_21222/m.38740 type:complete len:192 (+) Transcript_21222:39-614(+)